MRNARPGTSAVALSPASLDYSSVPHKAHATGSTSGGTVICSEASGSDDIHVHGRAADVPPSLRDLHGGMPWSELLLQLLQRERLEELRATDPGGAHVVEKRDAALFARYMHGLQTYGRPHGCEEVDEEGEGALQHTWGTDDYDEYEPDEPFDDAPSLGHGGEPSGDDLDLAGFDGLALEGLRPQGTGGGGPEPRADEPSSSAGLLDGRGEEGSAHVVRRLDELPLEAGVGGSIDDIMSALAADLEDDLVQSPDLVAAEELSDDDGPPLHAPLPRASPLVAAAAAAGAAASPPPRASRLAARGLIQARALGSGAPGWLGAGSEATSTGPEASAPLGRTDSELPSATLAAPSAAPAASRGDGWAGWSPLRQLRRGSGTSASSAGSHSDRSHRPSHASVSSSLTSTGRVGAIDARSRQLQGAQLAMAVSSPRVCVSDVMSYLSSAADGLANDGLADGLGMADGLEDIESGSPAPKRTRPADATVAVAPPPPPPPHRVAAAAPGARPRRRPSAEGGRDWRQRALAAEAEVESLRAQQTRGVLTAAAQQLRSTAESLSSLSLGVGGEDGGRGGRDASPLPLTGREASRRDAAWMREHGRRLVWEGEPTVLSRGGADGSLVIRL